MKLNTALHFSSATDLWATPQDFFDRLDRVFHFDLDVCALAENAKCARFFSPEEDGLSQPWTGVAWMNPPYGRGIGAWVQKAFESAGGGRRSFAYCQRAQTRSGGTNTAPRGRFSS